MKRYYVVLVCLTMMLSLNTGLKAQQVTIPLMPGWNWISYPSLDTVDFATAFGSFIPLTDDVIASQYGYSEYDDIDGQWYGSVQQFYPGWGYIYYSNRTTPVTFTFQMQQPVSPVAITTLEPTDITASSAMVTSMVAIPEGCHVFLRGLCWGTEPNPDIDGDHIAGDAVTGSQNYTLDGLTPNTTYYVRSYAVTDYGLAYGEEQSFNTLVEYQYVDLGLPSGLLWATCNVGADNPEDYGDYFAWGETQPKDTYNYRTYQFCDGPNQGLTKYCNNSSYGYNGFIDNLTTLLPEDDVATANWGSGWRMPTYDNWVELYQNTTSTSHTTQNGVNGRLFTASNGNTLFLPGAGRYYHSSLYETATSGYYWSSSLNTGSPGCAWGFVIGSSKVVNSYGRCWGFTVRPVCSSGQNTTFIINATASSTAGGTVSGVGTYNYGSTCTLSAAANSGYTFANWTEDGEVVSTDATYTFTVNSNRTLIANFTSNGGSNAPTGAINGKFTINANGDQVYFSQGNLQYQASTNTWRFAENQYDYVGSDNSNISSTYSGWIDLFGWGTSGYNHGANCYQPWSWSTSTSSSDYYAYGNYQYNLYDQTGQADWGYNPISNGGNQTNQWRTLTQPEWYYVFSTRTTTSGIRYAKANVNNVNGVILLPDDWSASTYSLSSTNTYNASFSSNTLTASQWSTLEQAGAVFLPAAGAGDGTSAIEVGDHGIYWSASYGSIYGACSVFFDDWFLYTDNDGDRSFGFSVRLARVAE